MHISNSKTLKNQVNNADIKLKCCDQKNSANKSKQYPIIKNDLGNDVRLNL
jgi:hypothetical protein